jgi:hypothetical protein
VDGVGYRWKVRGRPSCSQVLGWSPLHFVAERAEGAGAGLLVEMPAAHPRNLRGLPGATVTPGLVATAIRSALAAGWQPGRPGSVFVVPDDRYVPLI